MQDIETVGHNLQADASSLVNLARVHLLMRLPVRLSVCIHTSAWSLLFVSLFVCTLWLSAGLLVCFSPCLLVCMAAGFAVRVADYVQYLN